MTKKEAINRLKEIFKRAATNRFSANCVAGNLHPCKFLIMEESEIREILNLINEIYECAQDTEDGIRW